MLNWLSQKTPERGGRRFMIFVGFYGLFLLPVIILGFYNYYTAKGNLTQLVFARRQAVAVPVVAALNERLRNLMDVSASFASHPQVQGEVEDKHWDEAIRVLEIYKNLKQESYIDRIFLTDPQGTAMALTPPFAGVVGQNFAFRDWYQGVVRTGKPYVSAVYQRTSGPQYNVVSIATPILDDHNQVIGYLGIQIRLDNFLDWIKTIDIGLEGVVYIVDQKGKIVAHPGFFPQDAIVDFSEVPAVQKVMKGERGVEFGFSPVEKEEQIMAYEPIGEAGWGALVVESKQAASDALNFALRDILITHGILGLHIVFLAYLLLKKPTIPGTI